MTHVPRARMRRPYYFPISFDKLSTPHCHLVVRFTYLPRVKLASGEFGFFFSEVLLQAQNILQQQNKTEQVLPLKF